MSDVAEAQATPTLDSLAPASPAPAPAASPAPAAAPAAAAPVAAPAAPAASSYEQLLKDLGYRDVGDLRSDLAMAARLRQDVAARRAEAERNDPARREVAQRGEAFRQLVAEGYSPEHVDGIARLPEITAFLEAQRADGAQRDMLDGLRELGVSDDGSKEAKAEIAAWEDVIEARLMSRSQQGLDWNRRYFGTPAERRAVIHEIIATEEGRINRSLLRQNAQTLRDHAARRSSTASNPRSVPLPQVRQEPITATDPAERRRQATAATSRTLDDIHAHYAR